MTQDKEKILQEKLEILKAKWEANPLPSRPSVIDTERELIPITADIPSSAFDFEEGMGNTTYEVVGHFNPSAKENLLQKILRMAMEEKSLQ